MGSAHFKDFILAQVEQSVAIDVVFLEVFYENLHSYLDEKVFDVFDRPEEHFLVLEHKLGDATELIYFFQAGGVVLNQVLMRNRNLFFLFPICYLNVLE